MKKIKFLTPIIAVAATSSVVAPLASCGNGQILSDETVNELTKATLGEFIALDATPRPSNVTERKQESDPDALEVARLYLKNRIETLGYEFHKDWYGNIWFDVPATKGWENKPKIILQAHYDMVVEIPDNDHDDPRDKDIRLPEAKKQGIKLVFEEKEINGTKHQVVHSLNYKTSIGADDGIGVASILALIQNKNVNHGKLRVLFTSDEEVGMFGAKKLQEGVIDSDYLICVDGEGTKETPYVICDACMGFTEYTYDKDFTLANKTLSTPLTLTLENFFGKHFIDDAVTYNHISANADKLIFEILSKIIANGGEVEIAGFEHDSNATWEPRYLPTIATVKFVTNVSKSVVQGYVNDVMNDAKTKYLNETWTGDNAAKATLDDDSTITNVIDKNDSKNLIQVFGEGIKYEVTDWMGNNDEEKVKNNYPQKCSTFSFPSLNTSGHFHCSARGMSGTNANNDALAVNQKDSWTAKFGSEGLYEVKNHYPWDSTGKKKLLDLTEKAYKSINITPAYSKPRGGVEPAYFMLQRDNLNQTVIGPWMEDIHSPNETLFIETIPATLKVMAYLFKNVG